MWWIWMPMWMCVGCVNVIWYLDVLWMPAAACLGEAVCLGKGMWVGLRVMLWSWAHLWVLVSSLLGTRIFGAPWVLSVSPIRISDTWFCKGT